jgi:hypothetical protein
MSVLDQIRALEQEVLQRLRELRPLVNEYRDLEKVAERLGLRRDTDEAIEPAEAEATEPSPQREPESKRRPKPAARARRSKRAAAGKPKPTGAATQRAAAKPKPKAASSKAKPKAAAQAKPEAAAKPKPVSKPKSRGASAGRKPSARKRTAAAPGQREQDVLRLVAERPGVTVAELAAELAVDATGLYGVVRRLQRKDQIRKDGPHLRLADAAAPAGDDAAQPAPGPAATGEDATPDEAQSAGETAITDESTSG